MNHYITPPAARKKLKAAKALGQTTYIYGAAGYGKTSFIQSELAKRKHVYLSCGDRKWGESAFPPVFGGEGKRIVVIDDLHLLEESRRKLVEELAVRSDLWLILISRSPVPPWLARPYAERGFMVLGEKDLSLGTEEIARYLKGLQAAYTGEDLSFLAERSQGNAYVLRRAAMKLAEGQPAGPRLQRELRDALGQWIEKDIMAQWDSELLEFLMQVSVVDEFTLPLAELITADRLASAMVEKALEAGNFLFQDEEVYRLRPVLLQALRKGAPRVLGEERVKACARNAGVYYEMNGQTEQALAMYEQSGSPAQIKKVLIHSARMDPGAGHCYELRRYYLRIEREEAEKSPVLMAGLSMLHSIRMDLEKSEYWYNRLAEFAGTAQGGARREAQSRLCYLDIGLPHRGSGELLKILRRVPDLFPDQGMSLPEFDMTGNLPSVLNGAKDFCGWSRSDRALAGTAGPLAERVLGRYGRGLTKTALGESLLEKGGDAFEILTLLSEGQMEIEHGGRLETAFAAVGQRVRLMVLQGDLAGAGDILDSFQRAAEGQKAVRLLPNLRALRCRLALYAGNLEAVRRWLEEAPDEDKEFITLECYRCFTKARCYLAEGENSRALALLDKLGEYARRCQRTYVGMEAGLLKAIAQRRLGAEWEASLSDILDQAESYHFVRIITQLGPAILPLLKSQNRDTPWFRQVTEEAARMAKRYPQYLRPKRADGQNFCQTAREILRLQGEGLTAPQIAASLSMKPNTVRYHIKENYRKLGARGKAEAIAAAQGLGVI